MADGPVTGALKRGVISTEDNLGRSPDPVLALNTIAPALPSTSAQMRQNQKVPRTQDATIAEGLYQAEDRSYPFAEINRVKILPINDLHALGRRDTLGPDIVKMCQDLSIERVMIADTLPSDPIVSLIKALVRSGVKVEFVDHHAGDYMNGPSRRGYQNNHRELHANLDPMQGHRFVSTDRDDAASVAQLIPQGDLVKRGVGLYICAPPDADGVFSGVRGAGVDMSRTDEGGANCFDTVTALGLRDSPRSQPSQDARREAQGRREPEWLREFYVYHGYLKTSPERMVRGIVGMALCAKEGQLVEGKGDDVLSELRDGAGARSKAVTRLVDNYYDETYFADKKIFVLDLTAVQAGAIAPLDQVFTSKEEQRIVAELLSRGPGGLDTQELRRSIENHMKNLNEDRCVLALIMGSRDGIGKCVEVTGIGAFYDRNQQGTGMDFLQLSQRLGQRVGGLVGHRAHIELGSAPNEQEANFSKLVSALGDMVSEANRRPGSSDDPYTVRQRARLGLDID